MVAHRVARGKVGAGMSRIRSRGIEMRTSDCRASVSFFTTLRATETEQSRDERWSDQSRGSRL